MTKHEKGVARRECFEKELYEFTGSLGQVTDNFFILPPSK